MKSIIAVEEVSAQALGDVVDVFHDAFFDYPMMHFIIGAEDPDYELKLPLLLDFFCRARFLRRDIVLAARKEGAMIGAASLVRPESVASEELEIYRQRLWGKLGEEARSRYESFGEATDPLSVVESHYHLSLLGVRKSEAGKGVGRVLLDAVHLCSQSDPRSSGVSLTTETPENVALYEHVGYQAQGRVKLDWVTSWTLFRPDDV